jgi:antitoxin HicB
MSIEVARYPSRDEGMTKKNPHWGTTLDALLDAEGIREEAKTAAVTRVLAWQLTQETERQGITKATLAEKMHTSRAQVDRILKAKGNITIDALQRAAALVSRELRVELV